MTTLDKLKSIAEKRGLEYFFSEKTMLAYTKEEYESQVKIFKSLANAIPVTDSETTETLRSALKVAIAQLEIYEGAIEFYGDENLYDVHLHGIDGTYPGDQYLHGYEILDCELKTNIDGTLYKSHGKHARQAKLDADKLGEGL